MHIKWIEELVNHGSIKKLPASTHPIFVGTLERFVDSFSLKQSFVPVRFLNKTVAVNDSSY